MGASYYAYAVIGVEVTGKLHTITKQPSCAHQPSGAFCASCGKPNKTIGIAVETGNLNYSDNSHKRLDLSEIAVRINNLRHQLTEIGLWDEASFGLWAVGHCSY